MNQFQDWTVDDPGSIWPASGTASSTTNNRPYTGAGITGASLSCPPVTVPIPTVPTVGSNSVPGGSMAVGILTVRTAVELDAERVCNIFF